MLGSSAVARRFASLRPVLALSVTLCATIAAVLLIDIDAALRSVQRVSTLTFAMVTLPLVCGALIASVRLAVVAADLGYRIRAAEAVLALCLGQLAGAAFFQLVGQLVMRSALLTRQGVPVAGTIAITGVERLLGLVAAFGFAIFGGWHLFGQVTISLEAGGASFIKLIVGGVSAVAVSSAYAWGAPTIRFIRESVGSRSAWKLTRSLFLSFAIQGCTIVAYVFATESLSPGLRTTDVLAASAIVMLAAAVPVSLAGWGVRELSAIYALGAIGIDKETAFLIAVLIGISALAAVALLAVVAAFFKVGPRPLTPERPQVPYIDPAAFLAWSVPIAAGIAVYFQVHVPLSHSQLNINLADPLAVIGAALFAMELVKARVWPSWRLPQMNAHLVTMTALMVAAFVHGWMEFGVTAWALANRLAGWFVLLGYLATGAVIVRVGGKAGLITLLQTFAAATLPIIVIEVALFAAVRIGLNVPAELVKYRSEGFAQNANAFGLQLILATAACLVGIQRPRLSTLCLGAIFVGLWFSGSRSGLASLAIVVIAALLSRQVKPRQLAAAAAMTLAVLLTVDWLPPALMAAAEAARTTTNAVAGIFVETPPANGPALALAAPAYSPFAVVASGYEASAAERFTSLQDALAMFLAHPVFGGGLGAFVQRQIHTSGAPLVVHSTPLWLLAETGIIGFLVFAVPFIRTLKNEILVDDRTDPARMFLMLSLFGFATMTAVHDMLYQRAFWLLLGAAMALKISPPSQSDA